MTFRASNITPVAAYAVVRQTAVNLKATAQAAVSEMSSGPTDYDDLREIYAFLVNANNQFNDLKTTPGIAAYAQEAEDDPAYDVTAEFTAMQAALNNVLSWMDANVPTSVTTRPTTTWDVPGTLISDTFSVGQTSGLRTQLNALVASIS